MKISIIGLGWFGYQLAKDCREKHQILGTSRSESKIQVFKEEGIEAFELLYPQIPDLSLLAADVIVLNIPPFQQQLEWFKSWPWVREKHLIFISSTSVYGQNQGTISEDTLPIPETLSVQLLLQEEEWVKKNFSSHTLVRFGGLLGNERHPGKHLSGKMNLSHGQQPVNLVHLDDTVGFVKCVLEQKIFGTYNLVSDEHRSRKDFYQDYCQSQNLPLPHFLEDETAGKIISNSKVKKIYQLKKPLL